MAIELLRIERNGVEDSVTYAALVLHKTSAYPEVATMPFGSTMESKYYNFYKNTVKFGIHDKRSYEVFWEPINALIKDAQTIYISADGVYNKVNINTIFNVNTDNYLIEDYFVKYISSTKDLINRKSAQSSVGQSILAMGDPAYDLEGSPGIPAKLNEVQRSHLNMNQISPLPGTKREVDYIDSLLRLNNWNVQAYLGAGALEKQLKEEKSTKVIHLATHGFFMPDLKLTELESQVGVNEYDRNPLFRSGLLFAGASNIHEGVENDGVHTAYEAMNLYLDDTELVVLSACETALGDVKNGEGVYGLQRALMVAGAQNLIMSLWKVNDEATMKLMQLFYSNWTAGEDVYQSLQKAQIQMMKEHEEPYYWGGFIMIGI
jgi:CHAT domain-containing protein